jgi:hypothetical protein
MQLRYNDLTFFFKCLDRDVDMDAIARITTGRIMRNSNGEHRLSSPQERALTLVSTHSPSDSPPSEIPSLSSSKLFQHPISQMMLV